MEDDDILGDCEMPEPTEQEEQDLDRRLAEHRRNPSAVIPWEEVKRRILQGR